MIRITGQSRIQLGITMQASFVQDELRPFAMKLHTKDQAPKEGQQRAQVPFTKWEATRSDYLRFLVDSLEVYDTLDRLVTTQPELSVLRNTGLERSNALRKDIQWMQDFDPTLTVPGVGAAGASYAVFLRDLAQRSVPGFVCHFYNQYFAHTAGGMRIGQNIATKLLGGKKLQFYTWEEGDDAGGDGHQSGKEGEHRSMKGKDVSQLQAAEGRESTAVDGPHARGGGGGLSSSNSEESQHVQRLKEELRLRIDALAQGWTPEQRLACCEETRNCFSFGQALLGYLSGGVPVGGGGAGTGADVVVAAASVAAASSPDH
jgi:heme oxygenase